MCSSLVWGYSFYYCRINWAEFIAIPLELTWWIRNTLSRTVCQQPWPDLAGRLKSDPAMFSVLLTRSHSLSLLLTLLRPSNNRPIICVQVFPPPLEAVTLEESGCAVHALAWPRRLTHGHTCTDPLRLITAVVKELGWVLENVYYAERMLTLISAWSNTVSDVKWKRGHYPDSFKKKKKKSFCPLSLVSACSFLPVFYSLSLSHPSQAWIP